VAETVMVPGVTTGWTLPDVTKYHGEVHADDWEPLKARTRQK